jgi:hypothetical protein
MHSYALRTNNNTDHRPVPLRSVTNHAALARKYPSHTSAPVRLHILYTPWLCLDIRSQSTLAHRQPFTAVVTVVVWEPPSVKLAKHNMPLSTPIS